MDDKAYYMATGLSLAAFLLLLHRLVVVGRAGGGKLPPSPPAVPFLGHLPC